MHDGTKRRDDGELESTDSWTLLEVDVNETGAGIKTSPTDKRGKNTDKLDNNHQMDNGFLQFDDLFQEHLSESDSRPKRKRGTKGKRKKTAKKSRRSKSESVNLLSIFGAMLTVTGLSLLALLFPQSLDRESFHTVEENFMDILAHKNATMENVVHNFSKTSEVMDIAKNARLLERCGERFSPVEMYDLSEQPLNTTSNAIKENNDSFPHLSLSSGLESFLEIYRNPRFLFILSTITHDLCLLKILYDCKKNCNNGNVQPDGNIVEEKQENFVEKEKLVSPLENCETINNNTRKCSSQNMLFASKLKSTPIIKFQKAASELLVNSSMPSDGNGSELVNLYVCSGCNKSENMNDYKEQFKKLENMWNHIGFNHRQNIQQIKAQFQNEMAEMKEQPSESTSYMSRKEKILVLREKYAQQLKRNREKYFAELKKLREEREQIMRQLCFNSHKIRHDRKNVSVGNYEVTSPSMDDLRKLSLLKRQESVLKVKNSESVNNTVAKGDEISKNKSLELKLNERRIEHNRLKQNYLNKKIKQSKKKTNTSLMQRKENAMELYKAFFGKDAEAIKNKDMMKWYPKRKRSQNSGYVYKKTFSNTTKHNFSYKSVL